jgi:ABC-type multidrug transport system ATPase subunit
MLEFDSLYLEFGHHRVLQDVYVKCETGEVVGIIGRNGSGKSCLMKIVFGSMKAYMQSVRINQTNILQTNIPKGYINYLPQESFLPPFLKVKEALKQYNIDPDDLTRFIPELTDRQNHAINRLSGGEIRLIEVYLILQSPSLFSILDEPFSGLMPIHIERVISLIKQAGIHKGIILTDHQYRYLMPIADKLFLLVNGKTIPVKDSNELIRFGYLPDS